MMNEKLGSVKKLTDLERSVKKKLTDVLGSVKKITRPFGIDQKNLPTFWGWSKN